MFLYACVRLVVCVRVCIDCVCEFCVLRGFRLCGLSSVTLARTYTHCSRARQRLFIFRRRRAPRLSGGERAHTLSAFFCLSRATRSRASRGLGSRSHVRPSGYNNDHVPRPSTIRYYSKVWNLRNQEIETETLIFAPISLSYIEID